MCPIHSLIPPINSPREDETSCMSDTDECFESPIQATDADSPQHIRKKTFKI